MTWAMKLYLMWSVTSWPISNPPNNASVVLADIDLGNLIHAVLVTVL